MTCSICKKDVDVVWIVTASKQSCYNCLYPHEKLQIDRDRAAAKCTAEVQGVKK